MRRWFALSTVAILLVFVSSDLVKTAQAGSEDSQKKTRASVKRDKIDVMARDTLDELFSKSPAAKKLYDRAAAYAVFDNLKFAIFLTGGGGVGVAVDKASGKRIYMKMGTAGIGVGLGGQKYQIVFFFQDHDTFDKFVQEGWQADSSANAVAGVAGANAEATFQDGVAFYMLTEGGLMANIDISGTKFWKYDKLNS
ncbi:MAG: YSC84-related protein [Acidobacteriota bacterium]